MPSNKQEELEAEGNAKQVNEDATAEEGAIEALSGEEGQQTETTQESSIIDSVLSTVSSIASSVAETVSDGVSTVVSAVTPDSANDDKKAHHSKRAEKIGIVQSDKMTKTVTVRVDRVVKHPVYRKYIKRRKKFMAHDELGATVGDKVRIMETRPLSARKRWRVVEIVQKAVK
jgi:small subunit ribosomal protein S17